LLLSLSSSSSSSSGLLDVSSIILRTTRCFVHRPPPDYSLFRPDYSLFHEKNTPTEPNRTEPNETPPPSPPFVPRARSTPAPTNKACLLSLFFFCSLSIYYEIVIRIVKLFGEIIRIVIIIACNNYGGFSTPRLASFPDKKNYVLKFRIWVNPDKNYVSKI
jgi:hypothetical protein